MTLAWGCFFWEVYFFSDPTSSSSIDDQLHLLPSHTLHHANKPEQSQGLELGHLTDLTHTSVIEYTRQVIRPVQFQGKRPELTRINKRLLGPWTQVQRAKMSAAAIPMKETLVLEIPIPPEADTSIFSFGMASTVPRMQDSISGISHWLSHSQAQLHVLAPADHNASHVEAHMRKAYMNVTIHANQLPFAKRYVSLVEKLYKERSANTRWLVLVDDDTFFPSLASLASHFTRTYDPTVPLIVGAISDDLRVIEIYGMAVSGGGGIFSM